jgi:ankyrin repeat protein
MKRKYKILNIIYNTLKLKMSLEQFVDLCISGKLEEAKKFLEENPTIDPTAKNDLYFRNALGCACESGHLEVAQWLYQINPDNAEFAFQKACINGNLDFAKWLLEVKPTIDISSHDDYAFRWVCKYGNLELAQWLLNVKPDIDISANNEEAFREACYNKHLEVAKWLLEVKPTIDISVFDHRAFRLACTYSNNSFEIAKWLQSLNPEKYVIETKDNKVVYFEVNE